MALNNLAERLITPNFENSTFKLYSSENWTYVWFSKVKGQGWKIHISGNQDDFIKLAKTTIPTLINLKANFKIIKNYYVLMELNRDVKQIGKLITIYPKSNKHAVLIVKQLKPLLNNFSAPRILTDMQIEANNPINYRYGSFTHSYTDGYGKRIGYIYNNKGKLINDLKLLNYTKPSWVKDPFIKAGLSNYSKSKRTRLKKYKIAKYLLKKNKLIYLATYKKNNNDVIIKQARLFFKDNSDVFQEDFLKHEFLVLLNLNGIYNTPKSIELFEEDGILYSVIDAIKSDSLFNYIENSYYNCKPITDKECLLLINDIIKLVTKYHKKNLILGDINPNNIVIDLTGHIRFVDFDYAYFKGETWYHAETEGFSPPKIFTKSGISYDLYCLIGTIMFIATGRQLYLLVTKRSLFKHFHINVKLIRPTLLNELTQIFLKLSKLIKQYDMNEQ